ncbi:MAG TPA: protein kinase [Longimicrobium sp.]|nr:protein kinase [Longimicrobium sp.]
MTLPQSCSQCGRSVAAADAACPACGATSGGSPAPADSRWEALRERVAAAVAPRYRVLRVLGYGGMAGVYLAEEPRLARRVAIKVMAPEMMADPALVGRFQQEARTTAQLSHPHIVTVFDVDERGGFHYFVMAYVAGRTLAQVLATHPGPLPIAAATHWLFQAGSALAHAHAAGVVHRDVKPGNVLLDAGGNALVNDFGIAKVSDAQGLTRTGMLVGTPLYTSPEYCLTGVVTGASDQYSLGVVAYEMLTGAPPFTGPTLATLQAHVTQRPRPLAEARPDCPSALRDAVERMLEKRPEDRFAGLHEALEAMQAAPLAPTHPFRPLLATLCVAAETLSLSAPPAAVRAGDSFALAAEVLDRAGNRLEGRPVSWLSTDPAVATVDGAGVVRAVGAGEARICAACEGAGASVTVEVDAAAVGRIELLPAAGRIAAGERVQMQARVVGHDGGDLRRSVTWSSSNPNLAMVTPDGRVEALQPGSVSIFASAGTQSGAAVLTIERPAPVLPSAAPDSASLLIPGGARMVSGGFAAPVDGSAPGIAAGLGTETGEKTGAGDGDAPARKRGRGMMIGGVAGAALVVAAIAIGLAARSDAADDAAAGPSAGKEADAGPAAASVLPAAPAALVTEGAAPAEGGPSPAPPSPPEPVAGAASVSAEIRIAGALPPGSVVTATGPDGRAWRLAARSTVPPGRYRVDASAPGHAAASTVLDLPGGGSRGWTPRLVPISPSSLPPAPAAAAPPSAPAIRPAAQPSPPPPSAQPSTPSAPAPGAVDPAEDARRVRAVVGDFVAAVESRDVGRIERHFPAAGGWLSAWRGFLTEPSVRDLRVTLGGVDAPQVDGGEARVRFTARLAWDDAGGSGQSRSVSFGATLRREGAGWALARIEGR